MFVARWVVHVAETDRAKQAVSDIFWVTTNIWGNDQNEIPLLQRITKPLAGEVNE